MSENKNSRTKANYPSSSGLKSPKERRNSERMGKTPAKNAPATKKLLIAMVVLILLILAVIILTISCGKKNEEPVGSIISEEPSFQEETPVDVPPVILNEKPVCLYIMDYDSMTCKKVSNINKEWSVEEDLEAFGAFATSEESFDFSSETQAHQEIWSRISTIKEYKIGYELSFDVNGIHKVITILEPGDIENNPDLYNGDYPEDGDYSGITGYMGAWVYDDMHQDGGFYIHITQEEVTDETLLTSIKLRPTPQSDEIDHLVLKGFTYSSSDEFDSDGHYIGNCGAIVNIEKQ